MCVMKMSTYMKFFKYSVINTDYFLVCTDNFTISLLILSGKQINHSESMFWFIIDYKNKLQ